MPLIVHLETATRICSVALAKNGTLISLRESATPNVHSSKLTHFIDEVFQESGLPVSALDAVAVSMGPGSYTGLRIGVAAAKGLCYALDKPLIAVPTLQAMAAGMLAKHPTVPGKGKQYLCPMLDARRMEVYCSVYDDRLREVRSTQAEIIDENSFARELQGAMILFGGEGADKCRTVISPYPNASFLEKFETSAAFMIPLALNRFHSGLFEDPAHFEPFYLKEFVAGKPRVKGLR
ncbi:MAG TPA: tRNA (adenosine(37)-N6)-threonylcarbamoyltransferase complex dimerization subunit type 1 TsaB [Bacteroidales bacterium]|nr:tRNA (adenosine(37)-N6)-threonylcarbamoyltransferase complex dimerization subunit type 1 TsaB [Bacteroidales bacterium]HPS73005.1 tRNA (adenosine(37)-N6)-threonylcarbamoyltransferase complex dimerization subunit type 1 TsaB [Bacteroidales bacterium]